MNNLNLKQLIREEIKFLLREGQSPINHKIDDKFLTLLFNNPNDCQDAKQYYSKVHAITTLDKKGLVIPITAIVRFLINTMQNKPYNPSTT